MRTRAMRRVTTRYTWDRLRVSFWFAPAILALMAALLAWAVYWLGWMATFGTLFFLVQHISVMLQAPDIAGAELLSAVASRTRVLPKLGNIEPDRAGYRDCPDRR